MNAYVKRALSLLLPICLLAQTQGPTPPAAETLILQIHVVQGEGATHTTGSRSTTNLIIKVTNETGRPVEGAAVSFRLPTTGPGGAFPNGLNSDVVITGEDGRATVSGVRWNRIPGPFEIRVTAVKGKARAGIIVPQYLSEAQTPPGNPSTSSTSGTRRKWLTLTAIVAAAAAGSVTAGLALGRRSTPASGSTSESGPSVGTPTITIGGPK